MFTAALVTMTKLWNQPKLYQQKNGKESVAYMYKGIFLFHKKQTYIICMKIGAAGDHSIKQIKPVQKEKYYLFSFLCGS